MTRLLVAGIAAIALVLPQAGNGSAVRVVVARLDVLADGRASSAALGVVRYGQVLPIVESAGRAAGWDHVTVFIDKAPVDGYVEAAAVVPARPSTPIDAALLRGGGISFAGASRDAGGGVSVAIDARGKTEWLPPIVTRAVPVAPVADGDVTAAPAVRAAIGGETPMPADPASPVTWAWLVPSDGLPDAGSTSPAVTVIYTNATSLPIERIQPTLVRLSPADAAWRVVATARGRADEPFRSVADWPLASSLVEHAVAGARAEGAVGLMKIRLARALEPGDYAVALRDLGAPSLAGARVFGGSALAAADPIIYGTVWAFRVR